MTVAGLKGDGGPESELRQAFHNMTCVPYWNSATVLFQNGTAGALPAVRKSAGAQVYVFLV